MSGSSIFSWNELRGRIYLIMGVVIAMNIGVWVLAYTSLSNYPKLLALCLLAYGFGLRHAVDADHIAAIDNVTRKFLQEKKTPVSIGFFFSLGHSTVVIVMSVFVAIGTLYMKNHLPDFQRIGGIIGTIVSAAFLFIIALINLIVFIDIYRVFKGMKKNEEYGDEQLEELFNKKGFLTRIFRPLFKFVSRSWHMYLVGFLFGLGFDTATEIALLGISSSEAALGASIWIIMIYPLVFTAGMCLIDTIDGIMMLGIYGWAFLKPMRKLFYNMTITLISFLIAFVIGGVEALGILSSELNYTGGFWSFINNLNDNFSYLGFIIIGVLVLSWLIATVIYKTSNVDSKAAVDC